jgi:hypothetical protein
MLVGISLVLSNSNLFKTNNKQIESEDENLVVKSFKSNENRSVKGDSSNGLKNINISKSDKDNYETIYSNLKKVDPIKWKNSIGANRFRKGVDSSKYNEIIDLPSKIKSMDKDSALELISKYPTGTYAVISKDFNLLSPISGKDRVDYKGFIDELNPNKAYLRALELQDKNSEEYEELAMKELGEAYSEESPDEEESYDGEVLSDSNVDMSGMNTSGLEGLKPRLVAFHNELTKYVPNAVVTSTVGGKHSSESKHYKGEAIDYGIRSNKNTGVREFLYTMKGKELMAKYGLGFIDESIHSKYGSAYHVGTDSAFVTKNRAELKMTKKPQVQQASNDEETIDTYKVNTNIY